MRSDIDLNKLRRLQRRAQQLHAAYGAVTDLWIDAGDRVNAQRTDLVRQLDMAVMGQRVGASATLEDVLALPAAERHHMGISNATVERLRQAQDDRAAHHAERDRLQAELQPLRSLLNRLEAFAGRDSMAMGAAA